jgi:hypothetical protein
VREKEGRKGEREVREREGRKGEKRREE